MDGDEKGALADRDAEETGRGATSGALCKSAGNQGKLSPSTAVEDGGHMFVIRVGAIGCSAFGLNRCSFGSA